MEIYTPSQQALRNIMRISLLQLTLLILSGSLSLAHDGRAQEVLNRAVTVKSRHQSMAAVLKKIESEAAVNFMYSPELIQSNQKITLNVFNKRLGDVLRELLTPLRIGYETSGSQILLKPANETGLIPLEDELVSLPAPVDISIKGNVTDENGAVLPGVSILVKGTQRGTTTDQAGGYSISVPDGSATLVFSYVGYISEERAVGNQATIDLSLSPDIKALSEVVVTALGIKKEKKAVGYAVQEVKGSEIVKAREANAISSLAGKVAGLTISPSPNLFGDPGIMLRGRSGVLIVVDNVIVKSDSWNLTPDDIESFSILKGANAAALYGALGVNGAIIITTKRGTRDKRGFAVEFNSSTQLQTGYNAIPTYQTEYGAGDGFKYAFKDGKGSGINDYDYFIWGPRFEGQPITQYNSPVNPQTGKLEPLPWTARGKNNLDNFLQDGLLSTNNISISSKNDKGDMRLSVSQTYQKGTVPNSQIASTNFNFNGGLNLGAKVRLETSINYNKQYTKNYPTLGYGPQSLIYLITVWGGTDYDIMDLKNYWKPGQEGIAVYNREYTLYNNPWLVAYENLRGYNKDDIYGYMKLDYSITGNLKFSARTNVSTYDLNRNTRYPYSGTFYNPYNRVGGYEQSYSQLWENNTEASLTYTKSFKDFGFSGAVYGNLRSVSAREMTGATKGGLIVPGVYTLANTKEPNSPTNRRASKQVGSVYSFIDLDYKNLLFLNMTGRVDRSSTLPKKNNTYFYPSVSLSSVVSDMISLPKAVSYVKLRGSYANVAGDLGTEPYDIYNILPSYSTYSTRWNNNVGVGYSGTLFNPDILPSRIKTLEAGLEARFFRNRLGFDLSFFRNVEGPGVVNVAVSNSSGVSSRQDNAYTYIRKGWEVAVSGTPVATKNFSWNVLANWSMNHRWLKEIDGVLNRDGNIRLAQRADGYYITDFQRDENGSMIVGTNGLPAYNPYASRIGYSDNNFIAGLNNTFKYKSLNLSFQVDGRFGGLIRNYLDGYQWSAGTHPESANEYRLLDWNNRDNPNWKGSVMTNDLRIISGQLSTDQDGKIVKDTREFAPNDKTVLWQTWARNFYQSGHELARNRSYAKLREVIVTYNIPANLTRSIPFVQNASISLVGRNLLYFTGKGTKNMDLDQYTGNVSDFQTPSVKSFGLNLNLTF